MTLEIQVVPWSDPRGEALRTAQKAEVSARYLEVYDETDSEPGPPPTAADVTLFLIVLDDGVPVACGGLRRLDDEHGEIKRMYATPAARGSGAAVAALRALEDEARALGWTRLVLETGTLQMEAVRFYEREGYTSIPAFGYYIGSPYSLCYERSLTTS